MEGEGKDGAAAICMRAGIEFRPWVLPKLQNQQRLPQAPAEPKFYLSKDIKRVFDAGLNKTTFTRMVGADISADNCYAVYNTRRAAMKWNGMGEFKTQGSLNDLARLNTGITTVDSAILFGVSEEIALQSFSEKSKGQRKDLRADEVFQHIHFISLNKYGARQLRLILAPDRKERLLGLLFEPDSRSFDCGSFEYDAYVDGAYVFSYLDGDLTRLIRFKEGIEDKQGRLEVLCFPHQVGFPKEYLAGRAVIKTIEMETIESALGIETNKICF